MVIWKNIINSVKDGNNLIILGDMNMVVRKGKDFGLSRKMKFVKFCQRNKMPGTYWKLQGDIWK